ncbi:hypothetical protein ACF8OI_18350 [Aeromonas bivalvium]|uniref:hypothetical protein n=1 Tax=Aeromonas bivalvium TaxID=440079 RepID=UPI00370ABEAC
MSKLRAEQPGLIPLPHLLFNRATVVISGDEPVMRITTRVDGSYLEDQHGRRGALRFQLQPCRRSGLSWLTKLMQA